MFSMTSGPAPAAPRPSSLTLRADKGFASGSPDETWITVNIYRRANSGITLMELLIATFVTSIVMLGVVSADISIQKYYKANSEKAVSGLNAVAMMNRINAAALGAQGSYTVPRDPGIVIDNSIATGGTGTAGVGANTFCVRNYAGSVGNDWQCFSRLGGSLYYCFKPSPITGICAVSDYKIADLSGISASFTQTTTTGSQKNLFQYSLVVPDSDGKTRTYQSSVTPMAHRL